MSATVRFRSSFPTLLNTMSKEPLPFTSWLNLPSASVRNMATGLSFLPSLNTRIVAKGSPSLDVSSASIPFTVVCAITADVVISNIVTRKN